MTRPDFRRSDVHFLSAGDVLRGWLYRPKSPSAACIVMSHGYSAVKEQYLDKYAEVFVSAELNVLLFDHACFGASDGVPRWQVDPDRQQAGIRDAIAFVRALDEIDAEHVGLWGSSYSGGHVLALAAIDHQLGAAVAQVPTISGSRTLSRRLSPEAAAAQRVASEADISAQRTGARPRLVDVTSSVPGQPCALPGADSHAFFSATRSFAPAWSPQVTLQSITMAGTNEPAACIEAISPVPLLMVVATEDRLTPTDLAIEAFERAGEPKRLEMIEGGHFTPYVEHFERTSSLARDWFVEHLLKHTSSAGIIR